MGKSEYAQVMSGECNMKRKSWRRIEENIPHNARNRWWGSSSILHYNFHFMSHRHFFVCFCAKIENLKNVKRIENSKSCESPESLEKSKNSRKGKDFLSGMSNVSPVSPMSTGPPGIWEAQDTVENDRIPVNAFFLWM